MHTKVRAITSSIALVASFTYAPSLGLGTSSYALNGTFHTRELGQGLRAPLKNDLLDPFRRDNFVCEIPGGPMCSETKCCQPGEFCDTIEGRAGCCPNDAETCGGSACAEQGSACCGDYVCDPGYECNHLNGYRGCCKPGTLKCPDHLCSYKPRPISLMDQSEAGAIQPRISLVRPDQPLPLLFLSAIARSKLSIL